MSLSLTRKDRAVAKEKAAALRVLRQRVGEHQGTFAQRFGVCRTTLLRWENGGFPTHRPLVERIEMVCRRIEQTLNRDYVRPPLDKRFFHNLRT